MQSILITGASSGFGRAVALELAREGWLVFASMRDPAKAGALLEQAGDARERIVPIALDVTDPAGVRAAVDSLLERTGGVLDAVLSNAGYSILGAFEDYADELCRQQMETNFFGALNVILSKIIGKIGVHMRNGYGFVGNRMLSARGREADRLILEGATPQDVDRVLVEFGFPMGPFQTRDLVGLDVGWSAARSTSGSVRDILNEHGRYGQKSGAGYYDYDEARRASPSAMTARIIEDFAARSGIDRRSIDDEEILDRLLYAMINEGAKILDEGIAARAADIDVVWVAGYGWPRFRGGPMYWADKQGLAQVLARLNALTEHGDEFVPAQLIQRLAVEGGSFAS